MALRINTNVAALNAHRQLLGTESRLSMSMEKLSSGYRINRASDDAAGLSIANRLRAEIRSLTVASRNVTEGRAMVSIAEGAAGQVETILERMKELATQGASSNAAQDISKLNAEFSALKEEITRIVNDTKYQGATLLKGFGSSVDTNSTVNTVAALDSIALSGASEGTYNITESASGAWSIAGPNGVTQQITVDDGGPQTLNFDALGITINLNASYAFDTTDGDFNGTTIIVESGSARYQVGSGNANGEDKIDLAISSLTIADLGLDSTDLASQTNAAAALTAIDSAIDAVGVVLGNIGAVMNRFDYTYSNLQVSIENFSASQSVIRDVDMAAEMVSFTKNQILLQAGTSMLAQANMSSQSVLSLMQ
ncbi:MAG TPA: flagellin [Deltaproteobacteria bacterium]|nr:flagellin [Deltaproteobacteria bacterium]HOI08660.1 flagellin [Deltaproteobacteria bacterium]